jgi:hypothetical protein
MGTNNLTTTLASPVGLSGGALGATKCIVANSVGATGRFIVTIAAGATTSNIPLGTATSSGQYTPYTIKNNTGSSATYSLGAAARTANNAPTGVIADYTRTVQVEYRISSTATSSDVTFGWTTGAEGGSFARGGSLEAGGYGGTSLYVTSFTPSAVTGSGTAAVPYQTTATAINLSTTPGSYNPIIIGNATYVVISTQNFTWVGTNSTSWNDAGNWSGGSGVPSSLDNVTIPASGVVAARPLTIANGETWSCINLTITGGGTNPNSTLIMNGTGTLNVSGTFATTSTTSLVSRLSLAATV